MEMIFYSRANKTHFHKKGFALGLILKVRGFETRKWPIGSFFYCLLTSHSVPVSEICQFISLFCLIFPPFCTAFTIYYIGLLSCNKINIQYIFQSKAVKYF